MKKYKVGNGDTLLLELGKVKRKEGRVKSCFNLVILYKGDFVTSILVSEWKLSQIQIQNSYNALQKPAV